MPSIFFYGNCQIKAISEYLRKVPEVKVTGVFYVEDCVCKLDMEKLLSSDFLVFQHCSCRALKDLYGHGYKDLSTFATQHLLKLTELTNTEHISIPSIYFNPYWPDQYLTLDRSVLNRVPKQWYKYLPNYTFDGNLLLEMLDLQDEIVACKNDPKKSMESSFAELKRREYELSVILPISDFLKSNYRSQRIMHTTNHPARAVFENLVQRMLPLLGIDADLELTEDFLLTDQRPPIADSVRSNLCLEFEESGPYFVNGQKMQDFAAYLNFYKSLSSELK
jgi:hypothetical protein